MEGIILFYKKFLTKEVEKRASSSSTQSGGELNSTFCFSPRLEGFCSTVLELIMHLISNGARTSPLYVPMGILWCSQDHK